MSLKKLPLFFFVTVIASNANAKNYKPDDHGPIGVMRDHVHNRGEFMTSFRSKIMEMKGLRNGNDKISTTDALDDYMMVPTKMTVKMYMVGAMYGVTDKFTISAMGSLIERDMDNINRMGKKSSKQTDGFGDFKLNGSYQFLKNDQAKSQFNLAISVPTGNFNKKYEGSRLPYPMQIGSGSYEINPGISYSGYKNSFSYGGQINGNFKLNKNSNNYQLGDKYNITGWVAKNLNQSFSISSRLDYNKYEAIEGRDVSLSQNMPGANPSLHNREMLDLLFGVNYLFAKDILNGNRIAIEIGAPIYQKIDGPMLGNNYKITIGWQNTF